MDNFNIAPAELSIAVVIINIVISLILQLWISWVYKKTHRGLSYSPSFIFTMLIVGLLGTFLMMIIHQNFIGSIALLGAFSLIRFRTILKETRDVAFLFFALSAGVAIGTGSYAAGIVSAVLISIIILALDKFRIGSSTDNSGFVLTFNAVDNIDIQAIKLLLTQRTKMFNLLQTRAHGTDMENYVFSLKLKDTMDAVEIVKALKKNPSITGVELITAEQTVEY